MAKPLPAQAAETKWRDLREWLARVDALGELKRVTGATSEEDIGAITEMLDHTEGSPCVLFDEISNFAPGYRVLVNSMGSIKRQAVTLGLDPAEASHDRLLQFWRERLKGFAPIPPVDVKRGAVQENILRDGEVPYHARSRHRQHQRRPLSQSSIRQDRYRHPRRAAAPWRHHQGKIYAARTALPLGHRRRHRSSAVFSCVRRGTDLWPERARLGRRRARRAHRSHPGRDHRPADSGPSGDRSRGFHYDGPIY